MLFLNVNERVMKHHSKSIDLYFAVHIGVFYEDIASVNLLIEEDAIPEREGILYRSMLTVIPKSGDRVIVTIERENCSAAIEQSFAKARRILLRRERGFRPDTGTNVNAAISESRRA